MCNLAANEGESRVRRQGEELRKMGVVGEGQKQVGRWKRR